MAACPRVRQIALIFTAVVTPFEVSLLKPGGFTDPLFIINRVIDCIFAIDIYVNFILIVEKTVTLAQGSVWVTDPKELACGYLKGWFALDILSVLVSGANIARRSHVCGTHSLSRGHACDGRGRFLLGGQRRQYELERI